MENELYNKINEQEKKDDNAPPIPIPASALKTWPGKVSLTCGIIALILILFAFLVHSLSKGISVFFFNSILFSSLMGIIFAITGIIFSIIQKKNHETNEDKWGLILSCFTLFLSILNPSFIYLLLFISYYLF